jgi:hypothetical protein
MSNNNKRPIIKITQPGRMIIPHMDSEMAVREKFEDRVQIFTLKLDELKNFSISSDGRYGIDLEIRIPEALTKEFMFLTYDIVVLEGLDSEIFSNTYLSKTLVVEDSRFEMSTDDASSKRRITSSIKLRLSRLREDSQLDIIYKLRTGTEESEKMLEIVTNQSRWSRETVLDWIEKYEEEIHCKYDDIVPDLLLLKKLEE